MKWITTIALAVLLAACASAPQTPAQSVYAVQGAYASALSAAVSYKQLPSCDQPGAPKLCSDAGIVAKLQEADDVAYVSLTAAQNIVRTPGAGLNATTAISAANQAVQAFASITSTLGVK
jgi:hypothetical protein